MKTCNTCKCNKVCDHNGYGYEDCGNYIPEKEMSFNDILRMVSNACIDVFYPGTKDIRGQVLECATQIYIAQMKG